MHLVYVHFLVLMEFRQQRNHPMLKFHTPLRAAQVWMDGGLGRKRIDVWIDVLMDGGLEEWVNGWIDI